MPWRLLLFGASGAIGQAVQETALALGWQVVAVSRRARPAQLGPTHWVSFDPDGGIIVDSDIESLGPYDAVCWTQGANLSDSVYRFNEADALDLYRANCVFVVDTLNQLLDAKLLRQGGARLCIVSSIWQERARQNKLSYVMTKAAVGGLVRSASADMAVDGHLVNAVLPGVLDTPMTQAALAPHQLSGIQAATQFNALPTTGGVASLIGYLCSEANVGVTGQSVAVDLGYSNVRIV